ncbi:MAG TPA: OmpA family protein [Bacteroidia bacterium]|nr:OmpA family protein [Bacteroidia bacterium]
MRRTIVLIVLLLFSLPDPGQINVIGRVLLNGQPMAQSKVMVYTGSVLSQSLNTGTSSEFMLKLPFGKMYRVVVQNNRSPDIYFEVLANSIPADNIAYRMTYELQVPLVDKRDEDIDSVVFRKAFHRIVFDGKNKMVADTVYNTQFSNHILKKQNQDRASLVAPGLTIYSGSFRCKDRPYADLNRVQMEISGEHNQNIRKQQINRLNAFAFTSHAQAEQFKLTLTVIDTALRGTTIQLLNNKGEVLGEMAGGNELRSLSLNKKDFERLADNNFAAHLGGKVVISSAKEKRFFADRNIYLLNKYYTIIEKTSTNMIGAFVFNDVVPDQNYFIGIDRSELWPGEKADILNKDDHFVIGLDSLRGDKISCALSSMFDLPYNDLLVAENELQMDIKANIFGDNVNNPIGNMKIILLNDAYEPIDSVLTNDFGNFKFKYLPFLKRFYLDADNSDNILDVFRNILIYSNDEHLIKIMTHQKGKKFVYKPLAPEINELREVEIEDPWMRLMDDEDPKAVGIDSIHNKLIVESIHFENNRYELSVQAREVLDKIILVLNDQRQIRIEIGAHTDNKGSEVENMKLSQQRAQAVHAYILAAGIESDRIVSKGYGESMPLVQCDDKHPCTEAELARNRRIEFKIINNKSAK